MSKIITCPYCKQDVEVTKIRTSEKVAFKYISFNKAVGICPNCLEEIHIAEIDDIIEQIQSINKKYANALKGYKNTSDISRDSEFYKDWDVITENKLIFDGTTDDEYPPIQRIVYNGSLKNEIGYDIVTVDIRYNDTLESIFEKVHTDKKYYFITYVELDDCIQEVCCMMWEDIEEMVSGIIFNKTDVNSYRYGKQKVKNKTVMV